jgi:hypothetical protein
MLIVTAYTAYSSFTPDSLGFTTITMRINLELGTPSQPAAVPPLTVPPEAGQRLHNLQLCFYVSSKPFQRRHVFSRS